MNESFSDDIFRVVVENRNTKKKLSIFNENDDPEY
jgi:hypothetical protein